MLTVNNDRLAFESGRIKTPVHRLLEPKGFKVHNLICKCKNLIFNVEYHQPVGEVFVCSRCGEWYVRDE